MKSLGAAVLFFPAALAWAEPSPPSSSIALMQSAAAAFRAGRLDEALTLTVRVLDREPDNGAAKNYVWTIARKMREEDARNALSPAAKRAGTKLALRDLDENRRRAQKALAELERSADRVRRQKSPADILKGMEGLEKLLGEEYSSERDEAAAAAYFDSILESLSDSLKKNKFVSKKDQFRAEGYLAYYRKDWSVAAAKWEAALREDPSDAQVRKDLQSLKEVSRRLEIQKKVQELIQQARTYDDTGYPREAAESWEAVVKLDRDSPGAKEHWAVARLAAEKADMQETLKAMTAKGIPLYKQGDYVGGAQVWLEVLQKDPGYSQARRWLAQVGPKLRAQETPPPAPKEKTPAPTAKKEPIVAPGSVVSSSVKAMELYRQGILFYTEGKLKEALSAWKECLKYDPNMAKAQQAVRQAETELAFQ